MFRSIRRAALVAATTLALAPTTVAPASAVEYSSTPTAAQSPTPNGRVYDILTVGNVVYIGGTFDRVRNPATGRMVVRSRLAAFDRVTGALLPWDPAANGTVRTLAVGPDGTIYAGGLLTAAGGATGTNVVALDPLLGTARPGFTTTTSGEVRDLALTGGGLFVAGNFGNVNGASRVGVARVDAGTGALDTGFNARLGGGRAVALDLTSSGELVVGGNFKTINGRAQLWLARVDPTTGADSGWAPDSVCDTCNVIDVVAHDDGRVYAAVGGGGGGRAVAWNLSGPQRLWIMRGDGDVQVVDVYDGRVYAGGHFGPGFNGQLRHQLAVLRASDGALLPPSIPFTGNDNPGLWAIEAGPDYLRLGGGFQAVEGATVARYASFPVSGL